MKVAMRKQSVRNAKCLSRACGTVSTVKGQRRVTEIYRIFFIRNTLFLKSMCAYGSFVVGPAQNDGSHTHQSVLCRVRGYELICY